jgi:hypothetical protein
VFGLEPTTIADGRGAGSGSPDAPFGCPASGPPRYSGIVVLWDTRGCYAFTASTSGVGAAECYDDDTISIVRPGGALTAESGLPPRSLFDEPRMSPEGDELILYSDSELRVYRYAAGSWTAAGSLPRPSNGSITASTPSSGLDRRVLLSDGQRVYEYANNGSGWTDTTQSYTFAELGVTEVERMNLSPDGLRLVFYGHGLPMDGAFFASRTSTSERFARAALLEGVPFPSYADPFMTADCSRVYFAADYAMYYVVQQL